MGLLAALAALATGGVVSAATSARTAAAATLTTSADRTINDAAFEAARQQYGLTREMKDGNTLHAWMWSSNTIKANMKEIAEAGWTSIQTEPVQLYKVNPNESLRDTFYENWWYVYQPIDDTVVGNRVMGTEEEFKAMCDEAHKYGVRVIVDVVANHFTSDWDAIQGKWKNHQSDWFRGGGGTSYNIQDNEWGDRYKVTHKALLGLWEINTDNPETGRSQQEYLKQIVADGADGFRYDAAKHIELPGEFSEDTNGSPYWTYMLDNGAQYQYGEVLQDGISRDADYAKLFNDASSNGGGVTASGFGYTVRTAITSGRLRAGDFEEYGDPAPADEVVTWVESHDNFGNNEDASWQIAKIPDDQIALGWVIIGSRQEGMPLYFNRPKGTGGQLFTSRDGTTTQYSEQSKLGEAGNDMWKDKRITAVNHFRNQMDGNVEWLHNPGDNTGVLLVERYNQNSDSADDGVAVANAGGDVSLVGVDTKLDDGTYPDQVNSGNSITVAGGTITSGTAKAGVSVFFNPGKANVHGSVTASPADTSFKTETIGVTLSASQATDLSYTTSEGASGTFTNGQTILIGGSTAAGQSITLTLTGTDASEGDNKGQKLTNTYTYRKLEIGSQTLSSHYSTNVPGMGARKTISVDGDIADWDESMKIAQGTANDDPRVYRTNSMYEVPIDLYALYGAWDDDNLYLMWEYTNVSDAVDPWDNYPLSQGVLYQSQNLAQWIAVNTGNDADRIGNGAAQQTGGTLWDNGLTFTQPVNRLIEMSTNGSNGPWIYGGDSTGLDSYAMYGKGESTDKATGKVTKASGIEFGYGMGILEDEVWGLFSWEGTDTTGQGDRWGVNGNPARVVGDITSDSGQWVNFNETHNDNKHNSATMDFHYEMKIPLSELGVTSGWVDSHGISVMVIGTMGLSAMDSLPYDLAMNDNADQPDTKSQVNNSYEKSDKDEMSAQFACIGKCPTNNGSTPTPAPSPSATTEPSPGSSATPSPSPGATTTPAPSPSPGATTTPAPTPTAAPSPSASPSPEPTQPTVTNRVYAAVSWGAAYAYVYTDGGANNGDWPGAAMTKAGNADSCGQTGYYYDVPGSLANGAYVIFSDGGSNRSTPDMQPGMPYSGGVMMWNGSTDSPSLAAVPCASPTPSTPVQPIAVGENEVAMYRLYNLFSGEHFYTAVDDERASLITAGWRDEGLGWIAPKSGIPVHRMYNPVAGDHHYTMSDEECGNLVAAGWRDEGIGWYSAEEGSAGSVPLYRQYNPFAAAGAHNYTTSSEENASLVSAGWRDEGIAWYAARANS